MELFYKGHKFDIQSTDIIGGIRIFHGNDKHIVARKGSHEGRVFTDIYAVVDELKSLIDNGVFETIRQVPDYKF